MNRIASRSWIVLVIALALTVGLVFFLCEYFMEAEEWVMFSGSPHVYSGGKATGIVTDRDGELLVSMDAEKEYSKDPLLRKATLHWVGDRQGNISTSAISHYADAMSGYDLINGVYTYGDAVGNLELTLSAQVQKVALEAMGDRKGTVAVYNYKTGELLCAVSTPTFDPDNVPDIAGDETGAYEGVYLNRFLQSAYIPGSIFKIVTTAAALETVSDIQEQTFICEGVQEIGGGKVTCAGVHGTQDLKEAFANSCNCAYAQITQLVGRDNMQRYVEQFGVTEPVSFDGITTVSGNYDISEATTLEFSWSGIGQHYDQINPCRFLTFMGTIASGGSGVEPHVVGSVSVGDEVTYQAKGVKTERIMSKTTAETLTSFLGNNVEVKYGAENFPGLTVCAKSGTGEVGGGRAPNAMFAGFVADEEYPLAFIVAVEEGGTGSQTCVPILSKVLEACKTLLDS